MNTSLSRRVLLLTGLGAGVIGILGCGGGGDDDVIPTPTPAPGPADWQVVPVDDGSTYLGTGAATVGSDLAMAVDQSNRTHLVYRGANLCRYALRLSSGAWQLEEADGRATGYESDIALDSAGQPHIIHRDSDGKLRYRYRGGSGWTTAGNLNNLAVDAKNPGIAIDSAGRILVVASGYSGGSASGDIVTLIYQGGTWQVPSTGILDATSSVYSATALDSGGNLHLAYRTDGSALQYSKLMGNSWQAPVLVGSMLQSVAMVVDSTGRPHIVFNTAFNTSYAVLNGGTWQVSTVVANSRQGARIAVDSNNRPHICLTTEGGDFLYFYPSGSGWASRTIDTSGNDGNCAIAVDSTNRVHLAWRSNQFNALRYTSGPAQ